MENLNRETGEKRGLGGFFGRITEATRRSIAKRRENIEAPLYDAAIFAISLIFARCHIIFGSYPLALGLIAILPSGVWIAVLGAAIGAVTLGKGGVVYAIISLIIAFLRIIVSGTDKSQTEGAVPRIFSESLTLRLSSAVIGGFIAAVYEVLLNGFGTASILFGVSMILLPPLSAFALSGLFEGGISPSQVFRDAGEVFSLRHLTGKEKYSVIFFQCSAAFGVFLVSVSLKQYELFGISLGYIFAGLAAIFTGRRFGALRGAVVGFVSAVGLSSVYSVAFALAGLAVGAFGKLGLVWSVVIGGGLLSLWGGYADGILGFLSIFPEYAIAGVVAVPLFKKIKLERSEEEIESAESLAEDMVGTMSLSYKSGYSGSLDILEGYLAEVSSLTAAKRRDSLKITKEDTERLIVECITEYFAREEGRIPGVDSAREEFISRVPIMTSIVYKNHKIKPEEIDTPPHLAKIREGIAGSICRGIAILEEERFREVTHDTSSEDFRYIAKLINEARLGDAREKTKNDRLTELCVKALTDMGIRGHSALAFGERTPHIIIAFEDQTGTLITSPELMRRISEATSLTFATPSYYRKGRMALLEVSATATLKASSKATGAPLGDGPSGDTPRHFTTRELCHFSLICDGMGSGECAARASGFVADFLERALELGAGLETSLSLVNNIIRRQREECSTSVDLFSLDLISGEALFYKCGAAPSYIKRGSSLFRIRSKTSPLGLSHAADIERIRAGVEVGDYVIMFSDGISDDGEAPWLIDLLSRDNSQSPDVLANKILATAKENRCERDDLTVLVTRVEGA